MRSCGRMKRKRVSDRSMQRYIIEPTPMHELTGPRECKPQAGRKFSSFILEARKLCFYKTRFRDLFGKNCETHSNRLLHPIHTLPSTHFACFCLSLSHPSSAPPPDIPFFSSRLFPHHIIHAGTSTAATPPPRPLQSRPAH